MGHGIQLRLGEKEELEHGSGKGFGGRACADVDYRCDSEAHLLDFLCERWISLRKRHLHADAVGTLHARLIDLISVHLHVQEYLWLYSWWFDQVSWVGMANDVLCLLISIAVDIRLCGYGSGVCRNWGKRQGPGALCIYIRRHKQIKNVMEESYC